MCSVPCPLLGNGSLNTFPQNQTRWKIGDLLLGNGSVNKLCQQYRLCFPWDPCKVDIRESISEAGSCGRTRMRIVGRVNTWMAHAQTFPSAQTRCAVLTTGDFSHYPGSARSVPWLWPTLLGRHVRTSDIRMKAVCAPKDKWSVLVLIGISPLAPM
jgi:hypothetical protein